MIVLVFVKKMDCDKTHQQAILGTGNMRIHSYQCEDMLVGSSCEDPRLVAEVQAPAQHPVPVLVPVVVMVDDPGETQRHVAKKRRVLDHVGVRCREVEREGRDKNIGTFKF